MLEGRIHLRIAVGSSLAGDVTVALRVHADAKGLIVRSAADEGREDSIPQPIEFHDKAIEAAPKLCLESARARRKIGRSGAAGEVDVPITVERDGVAVIIIAAADVGGKDQLG